MRGGDEEAARLLPGLPLDVEPDAAPSVSSSPRRAWTPKSRGTGSRATRALPPSRASSSDRRAWTGAALRGLWAHRIVVDEAGYVPDEVITDVLLPMLTDVGGELTLASSPAGRRNVFYRLWARGEGSPSDGLTIASFQCPSRDNPHLDKAFLAAMREELGETTYAAEYEAQFVDDFRGRVPGGGHRGRAGGRPARAAREGGNLVSAPQPGRLYSVGVDWGRKLDFTVVCVLDATERPARLVGLWRWQGGSWELLAARVGEVAAAFLPLRVLTDGNSIGDPMAENLQQAIRARVPDGERVPQVEQFLFGAESKTRLVDRLTLGLSGRALTYPPHKALLSELRGFEYGTVGASGRARMAARGSGHDDTVMALALAWYCAPEGAPAAARPAADPAGVAGGAGGAAFPRVGRSAAHRGLGDDGAGEGRRGGQSDRLREQPGGLPDDGAHSGQARRRHPVRRRADVEPEQRVGGRALAENEEVRVVTARRPVGRVEIS